MFPQNRRFQQNGASRGYQDHVQSYIKYYKSIDFNIVTSEDPGGNLNFRTNIKAQQSTRNNAMIYERNKFINRTNISLRLAASSENK